eukprot:jgi/Picre1/30725/NNA_006086.t1
MATLEEEKDVFLPPPPRTSSGTLAWYWMDMASLIPPLLLDVQPGHDVLDACAAPGGKSCILGRMLFRHDGTTHGSLTCNEPSAKRRQKLQAVLASYFESSYMDSRRIIVTGRPAEKKVEWRRRGSRRLFDRILIDAPCTHERHVLGQSATGVAGIQKDSWSIARCKRMAALQVRMVMAGIQSLKNDGRLVYSTCTLDNEKQNDGVIDKHERIRESKAKYFIQLDFFIDLRVALYKERWRRQGTYWREDSWTLHKEKTFCPTCKQPFSYLLTYRGLDGSLNDFPMEESVVLLRRAHWFEDWIRASQNDASQALLEDARVADDTAWMDDFDDDAYWKEDEEMEAFYFSSAAGKARIVLGNRRFGQGGFISGGIVRLAL